MRFDQLWRSVMFGDRDDLWTVWTVKSAVLPFQLKWANQSVPLPSFLEDSYYLCQSLKGSPDKSLDIYITQKN